MTVDKIEGDQVICHWSTEYGDVRSGSFQIAELAAPITIPPADPDQQETKRQPIVITESTARKDL